MDIGLSEENARATRASFSDTVNSGILEFLLPEYVRPSKQMPAMSFEFARCELCLRSTPCGARTQGRYPTQVSATSLLPAPNLDSSDGFVSPCGPTGNDGSRQHDERDWLRYPRHRFATMTGKYGMERLQSKP